ncbi:hypothetical protein EDD80_103330 [Anseongella ginsenosidimutans]|uniref:Uncharacterized protein n=1 Tax=Anseongella ginsenosidimutans TaxID=496056 RepID=A0A4R3KUX3_9SPHI|nr:hypothetical protein [Anseongella ginsenosidimutans]QEC53558.1 hypothetical protein FRZ59_15265 [Anseongella ginsenosidimutans]TCS88465.1 hypothetical protein EDD80_103330 [Anseongella ginsenosidimutans]
MFYLFWAIVNIGIFLLFLGICFRATILVRKRFGLFASLIFAFGLLSFIGSTESHNNTGANANGIWEFASGDSLDRAPAFQIIIELEDTWFSQRRLDITYGRDKKDGENIPINAYSFTSGLVSGTKWKPLSIDVRKTDNNAKFNYFVGGIVEWKLLGTTIFSQHQEYEGIASIK